MDVAVEQNTVPQVFINGVKTLTRGGAYRILRREDLAPRIHLLKIEAPSIAAKARAGQFVILRMDENGERIPLTLADWDAAEGTITLVFMEVGASTMMLATLAEGDAMTDVAGPLGIPSHVNNYGHVVCVAGGVGVAPVAPIARALKEAGNRITAIAGARSLNMLFWEERLRSASDRLIVTTDDGSYGIHGLVTGPLAEVLRAEKVDRVIAIGPAVMMKSCTECAAKFGLNTIVSLNSTMVDGTGMCGCCRVSVGGVTKFTCVDGPEFEGTLVDWGQFSARQRTYTEKESHSLKDCKWRAFQKTLAGG